MWRLRRIAATKNYDCWRELTSLVVITANNGFPVFARSFPFPERSRNKAGTSISGTDSILRNYFLSEKGVFYSLRERTEHWVGIGRAWEMKKTARGSNQERLSGTRCNNQPTK
jgi:hypothetical protein